jgi:predicted GIY-YIG superfamily endonuclease
MGASTGDPPSGSLAFFVYVLENPGGQFYVGQTADWAQRLARHNDPADRSTLHTKRRPGPWQLVYSESCASRAEAVRRERPRACL